ILGNVSGDVTFWDTATGKPAAGWTGPKMQEASDSPRFSPDGKTVFIGAKDGVAQWDPIAGKALRTLPGGRSRNLIVSPDGKYAAAVIGHWNSAIYLWDLESGKPAPPNSSETGHVQPVQELLFCKDGSNIVTAVRPDVLLWEASTGRLLLRFPEMGDSSTVAL